SDLPHNTEVAVRVNEFAFISENHGVIEIADNDTWYFTTEAAPDETPPAIVTISPPDNSTSVSVSSDLVITFDEPIFFGEGPTSAQLRKTGGAFVQDFFNNDNQFVEIEGNTLTLFPFEDLENNQEYYITIGQGFVEDEAGNESVALSSTTAWNFTTALPEDTDPPVVVSLNPLDNATGVALNADLTITFDESIQGVYTGSAFVRVKKVSTDAQILGGRPSHETDQFTIDGNTMTIHLAEYTNAAPEYETEYYVSIPFNSLEDASGNSFAGFEDNMTWSFTTETAPDDTPPSIISITPADNSIDVDPGTNLTIEFDEDVFLGNSSFLVKYYDTNINQFVINYASEDVSVSGNTITINPPGALQGETHYWIQINANTITDTAGNGFPGIVMANRDDWDFTTAGKLDQSITFETPDDKTFGDQPFTLTASASSGLPVTFSVVSGSISIDGDEVTIIGAGSASIRADQEGNEEYNSANGQIRSFDIAKADQTITVEKINNKLTTDDP
ncbi:MAG: Ig-like domain-containing protein, partial [Ekhidna sp.]